MESEQQRKEHLKAGSQIIDGKMYLDANHLKRDVFSNVPKTPEEIDELVKICNVMTEHHISGFLLGTTNVKVDEFEGPCEVINLESKEMKETFDGDSLPIPSWDDNPIWIIEVCGLLLARFGIQNLGQWLYKDDYLRKVLRVVAKLIQEKPQWTVWIFFNELESLFSNTNIEIIKMIDEEVGLDIIMLNCRDSEVMSVLLWSVMCETYPELYLTIQDRPAFIKLMLSFTPAITSNGTIIRQNVTAIQIAFYHLAAQVIEQITDAEVRESVWIVQKSRTKIDFWLMRKWQELKWWYRGRKFKFCTPYNLMLLGCCYASFLEPVPDLMDQTNKNQYESDEHKAYAETRLRTVKPLMNRMLDIRPVEYKKNRMIASMAIYPYSKALKQFAISYTNKTNLHLYYFNMLALTCGPEEVQDYIKFIPELLEDIESATVSDKKLEISLADMYGVPASAIWIFIDKMLFDKHVIEKTADMRERILDVCRKHVIASLKHQQICDSSLAALNLFDLATKMFREKLLTSQDDEQAMMSLIESLRGHQLCQRNGELRDKLVDLLSGIDEQEHEEEEDQQPKIKRRKFCSIL